MREELGTSDILEMTGLSMSTADRLIVDSELPVDFVGGGKGHRRFTLVQVVALVHAAGLRKLGMRPANLLRVIRFIAGHSEEQLQDHFRAGLGVCMGAHLERVNPPPVGSTDEERAERDTWNLAVSYRRVREFYAKKTAEAIWNVPGGAVEASVASK